MVTRTGFEPVNDAVKGRCVKPLHQRAMYVKSRRLLLDMPVYYNKHPYARQQDISRISI